MFVNWHNLGSRMVGDLIRSLFHRLGKVTTGFYPLTYRCVRCCSVRGAYIKQVRGGAGGFYKFFNENFVAQRTIDLNISWPGEFFQKNFMALPIILVSCLRLACGSISGYY